MNHIRVLLLQAKTKSRLDGVPRSGQNPPVKVDAQRPSTWVVFKKGLCEGCWAGCCTLPVEASAADLIRLGLITEDEAAESLKKVARRLHKQGMIQAFQAKNQIFVLEQRHGRDCIYLDKNRMCTVYEKRPEVCRQFPKIGPRPGWCPSAPRAKKKA